MSKYINKQRQDEICTWLQDNATSSDSADALADAAVDEFPEEFKDVEDGEMLDKNKAWLIEKANEAYDDVDAELDEDEGEDDEEDEGEDEEDELDDEAEIDDDDEE